MKLKNITICIEQATNLKSAQRRNSLNMVENKAIDEIDFEETRRCLLNSYHSDVQNHVGYLIVIVVGLLGLGSSYESLFKIISNYIFIFVGLLILGVLYDFLRIKYWTSYANVAIILPKNGAIKFFNDNPAERKYPYLKEAPAPYTAVLQIAIYSYLRNTANDKTNPWLSRQMLKLVLKTGG